MSAIFVKNYIYTWYICEGLQQFLSADICAVHTNCVDCLAARAVSQSGEDHVSHLVRNNTFQQTTKNLFKQQFLGANKIRFRHLVNQLTKVFVK